MSEPRRIYSIDIFRGITIALMVIVNNPGSWSNVYPPLLHAKWHGCTPTDLVFPFFLFLVGASMRFAFVKWHYFPSIKFYKRVQPGGWWGPITKNFNHTIQPVSKGILIQWVAGLMMIYGFTFGLGNFIFNQYSNSVLLFGCAFVGSYLVWNKSISKLN